MGTACGTFCFVFCIVSDILSCTVDRPFPIVAAPILAAIPAQGHGAPQGPDDGSQSVGPVRRSLYQ